MKVDERCGSASHAAKSSTERSEHVKARLQERYEQEFAAELRSRLGCDNVMELPRLEKVVISVGLGEAIQNPKAIESVERDLATISGQHPVIRRAKRSISAFKVRTGMPIGMMVTLRGKRMYDFLDRLINVALPRIRDFRGIPRDGFDGRGNYNLGIREQIVFPEVNYDKIDKVRGLQVTIATTAERDDEARMLLELMSMPFRKE